MKFFSLIVKSAFRNRLRTLLTSVGVAVAIVAFLFLRTFIAAWYAGVDSAANDRLFVRNKTSIIFPLPLAYVDKVKNVPGVSGVGYENWFGGYYKDPKNFFAKFAADDHVFEQFPEGDHSSRSAQKPTAKTSRARSSAKIWRRRTTGRWAIASR